MFVKKWPLEYQKVIKTSLPPTYETLVTVVTFVTVATVVTVVTLVTVVTVETKDCVTKIVTKI